MSIVPNDIMSHRHHFLDLHLLGISHNTLFTKKNVKKAQSNQSKSLFVDSITFTKPCICRLTRN